MKADSERDHTILVTGADGFVGRHLCPVLSAAGYAVRGAVWQPEHAFSADYPIEFVTTGDIGPGTDWTAALEGVGTVVHLAARVHVMKETATDPLAEFRRVNAAATARLAHMAAADGVKRFVFVSSIKVNGESTGGRAQGFSEDDPPDPDGPYAVSKWEAEQALHRIAADTALEVVIVRPPLVYGAGVGGNFLHLLRWAYRAMPLPLAGVNNRRSFVGVENLADFLLRCVQHPDATNETFVVSDGEDLATPELIRYLARGLGRPARLFPFPVSLLRLAARALGKEAMVDRLVGDLTVDAQKARRVLGWSPVLTVDESLARTARWYLDNCIRVA